MLRMLRVLRMVRVLRVLRVMRMVRMLRMLRMVRVYMRRVPLYDGDGVAALRRVRSVLRRVLRGPVPLGAIDAVGAVGPVRAVGPVGAVGAVAPGAAVHLLRRYEVRHYDLTLLKPMRGARVPAAAGTATATATATSTGRLETTFITSSPDTILN